MDGKPVGRAGLEGPEGRTVDVVGGGCPVGRVGEGPKE